MFKFVTIYALGDPDTLAVRYVGKTVDLMARIRSHRFEAKQGKDQTHRARWLRSLASDPVVTILATVKYCNWEEAERYWIAKMRRLGCNLTNCAAGGQTSPVEGIGHSEKTKQKLRASALRRGCRPPSQQGVKASLETRRKLSRMQKRIGNCPPANGGWNKGLKMSAEFVEKNRASHIGIPWLPARRAAQNKPLSRKRGD